MELELQRTGFASWEKISEEFWAMSGSITLQRLAKLT
jgi:hypothetical protein